MAADWWKTEGFTTESQYFHSCNTTEDHGPAVALSMWPVGAPCHFTHHYRVVSLSSLSDCADVLPVSIIVLGCLHWPHTMAYKQSGPIDENSMQLLAHFTTRPPHQNLLLCLLPVISLTHLVRLARKCILARSGNAADLHHTGVGVRWRKIAQTDLYLLPLYAVCNPILKNWSEKQC